MVYFVTSYLTHSTRARWNPHLRWSFPSAIQSQLPTQSQAISATFEKSISSKTNDEPNLKQFNAEFPFFFPGQGSQCVGMGVDTAREIPAAKELYARASSILEYDLLSVCEKGPKTVLDATDVAQPAIFVCSMAAVEKLRATKGNQEALKATVSLGLSLGEYSSTAACDTLERIAKPQFKALKTIRLPVAGAFHTNFMESAVPRLRKLLDGITIHKPRIPIISNVDAKAHTDPERIRELLIKQVTSPVLWENSVKSILENGFKVGYELGPGTTLSGILKRLDSTKALLPIV
ncbi:acyl transferase domain-containing protein [Cardiosporidium cionae]|uniref:Acyl transferase domain-containing protein n=1 Tax=Cardiosporidium cionae TaxID=476202 RepID=A0ABQ7JF21_9APIC|nr:acyl transferase domain-containing protein [Cardiosporidium cionae]|eukprot:KAF8822616.1 acyl transferase domain-containing protein [Cardiosporidium cionae]